MDKRETFLNGSLFFMDFILFSYSFFLVFNEKILRRVFFFKKSLPVQLFFLTLQRQN